MKKTLKRLLSLIIATFLILSFSIVPAFASSSPPTTWTPTSATAANTMKTITVKNVADGGATVTAYQIVKGTYKDGKLTGYELCDSVNAPIANIEAPTSTEITNIANYIEGHPTAFDSVQMTYQNSSSNYTATVEAGEYIVLARSSYITELEPHTNTYQQFYVYNPGLVAVNVTDANLINSSSSSGGTLSMYAQFSAGDTAYVKGDSFYFAKRIKKVDRLINTDTASFGSINSINFYFQPIVIPDYSQAYTAPQFTITDDLNPDGLENSPFLGVSGLKVILGTRRDRYGIISEGIEEVAAGEDTYTITYYDENGAVTNDATEAVKYKIEFADAFIRANHKLLTVDYSSNLTTNAKLALSDYSSDFISNNTRATLRYSNDPVDETSYNELSSETRIYTFGIDAVGNGIQTYELNKVTQAGGTYTSVLDNNDQEITKKSPNALAGATFTIYSNQAMTRAIGTATSDANGHIEFRGLAAGTYYLKETAAPSGYTLNANNYKVVISPTISETILTSYSVTTYLMGETDTQIGSATYTRSVDDTTDPPTYQITPTVTPAEVVNTTLVTLPTTGGVGTIVISVVAGLGMAVFLTIFVICKKRSSKKN